ncbi:MAG: hypothetical protein K1X67_04220 [Fimbriimonadaceae bacterium]|nr:hypothetical protein [Fimbriimonadaceae bacterium]
MKQLTLPLAFLALAAGASTAHAVPSLMIQATIVTGEPVFPSVMPSLMVADSSVVPIRTRNTFPASLNVTCKFQTFPVIGLFCRKAIIHVDGFSRRPLEVEAFNIASRSWARIGAATLPNNPTRTRFEINFSSPQMAGRFIDILGQMSVRIRRNDTRPFEIIMDCIGVETLY